MRKTPAIRGLLAGLMLLTGSAVPVLAQAYTPQQMLDPRLAPKHDDVDITIPSAAELANCKVEQVFGATKGSSGYLLKDGRGQPLRRFFATTGRNVDAWSYYKDGVEVYREFDTTGKGAPNNFRWLNAGGMKWGVGSVDAKGKAVISAWRMISAEEVAFEAYQAVAKQDYARLQALMLTDADLQAIKLPAAKIKAVQAAQQQSAKKFADLVKTLGNVKYEDVESIVPHCDTNNDSDIVLYPNRPIRYVAGKDDRKWLNTGEMVQIGMVWKLVEVPTTGEAQPIIGVRPGGPTVTPTEKVNPDLQKLLDQLAELDKNPPVTGGPGTKSAAVDAYLRKRIGLVQQIVALDKADQRESWYKQLFDNLMTMAQNSADDPTFETLKKMSNDVATQMPGTNLAAYGVYRLHWTAYAIGMFKAESAPATERPKVMTAVQDKWLESLADFAKKYPRADDTAEALYQLGNGCEFSGKIEEAKRWYGQLAEGFPNHHLAPRSKGCVARLSLVGNRLELVAPLLIDQSKAFDVNQLKGKIVIVHYWSSQSEQYDLDFRKLKRVLEDVGTKQNVELVSVGLDDTLAKCKDAVSKAGAPGIHLYQTPPNNAGGSNSPLSIQYGIHILPTVFIVGSDGRVTENNLQVNDIETALKKIAVPK